MPGENGTLDLGIVSARLHEATGIFIGGGDTPIYHRLYATEPIRSIIRERYQKGVLIAGLSAGALIAPEICAIPPEDTGDTSVRIVTGLGLVSDLVVGVHFTEWNALPHILEKLWPRLGRLLGWVLMKLLVLCLKMVSSNEFWASLLTGLK